MLAQFQCHFRLNPPPPPIRLHFTSKAFRQFKVCSMHGIRKCVYVLLLGGVLVTAPSYLMIVFARKMNVIHEFNNREFSHTSIPSHLSNIKPLLRVGLWMIHLRWLHLNWFVVFEANPNAKSTKNSSLWTAHYLFHGLYGGWMRCTLICNNSPPRNLCTIVSTSPLSCAQKLNVLNPLTTLIYLAQSINK